MIFNYHNFDEVFEFDPECTYDDETVAAIEQNRKDLEGLFIERVMKALGIKRPAKYYPPKSNSDLRNLHKTIVESGSADTQKISVLYYILLEFDYPTGQRNFSAALEQNAFLPAKYQIYMKGLWHLDRKEFELALQYLTHPSLVPTFADEVLEVLVRSSSKDLSLALAYYHIVQPALASRQAIECLFSALGRTSVTEAFYFCRGQPEYAQRHMFEMLVALVLNNSSSDTIAQRSIELVNLPFTKEEEDWFEDYILRGDGRALKKGKDTLMMRKIGTGDFAESLSLKGTHSRSIGGLDWTTLSNAVEDGLGPRLNT
ncbi:uncharacterized protein LY89DRAFT_783738 [Mollisia scopiformis]|uniref:ELYS-like domain-containing protein n=1 Tax=Mollisia scopiformis TaxID=149040 RepID=A0A194X383_MOLSC|nr:uncharacterized protein LY89DRAFT_783738 [Mollisia scopiformis]KUJ14641.1 hypothetical protein LY89DRAFT_783738 [Mollisia scopiformis]